jgi:hypothetical protein
MVYSVLEHAIPTPKQCRHHTQVCHVAGRKQQGTWPLYKPGQLFFQCMVDTAVTGNQVRRPATGTELIQALVKSGNNVRVICQPEIIVTAECQVLLACYPHLDTLRAINDLPAAIQVVIPAILQ